MYINPFLAGILATVAVELVALLIYGVVLMRKK